MEGPREVLTTAELDAMTPDERAHALDERRVTDLDDLPSAFRARVEKTGQRLASELRPKPTDRAHSGAKSGSPTSSTPLR
jgi:hypothetical protein